MPGEPLVGTIWPLLVLSVGAKVVVVFCVIWVLSEVPVDVGVVIFRAWPTPVESNATAPSRMIMRIEIATREYVKISIGTKRQVVLIECEGGYRFVRIRVQLGF